LLLLGLFALACAGGAALGLSIVVGFGGVRLPAFWPLCGVLLGALLLAEPRRWAEYVASASTIAAIAGAISGLPAFTAAVFALLVAAEAALAAWVLRRRADPFSLTHLVHLLAFVVVAALAPMAGGVVAAMLVRPGDGEWFDLWRAWWLKDALGMLVAPIVVAAAGASATSLRRPARTIELAVLLILGSTTSTLIFGERLSPVVQVPAYMLPFFLWAAFRFGVGETATVLTFLSFIGMWHTAHGSGPLALPGAAMSDWILRSQGTTAVAAASFLLMAAEVAERRRVARENEELVADLQKALTEIKTLRGFIPICAWCHKVRDDAGFWQQIERYLSERTDARFSHSICPLCAERALLESAPEDKPVFRQ
jgi:integral membrane sensor domain MASE1